MKQNNNMYTHFEAIVSLGDQPARTEIAYIIQGNEKILSKYRLVADISSISE